MARIGVYKKPPELKDEDKYGPFTKKHIVYILATFLICAAVFFFFKIFGLEILAMIIDMLIIEVAILMNWTMPSDKYLLGGGIKMEKILFRLVRKQFFRKKVLFVKNFKKKEHIS